MNITDKHQLNIVSLQTTAETGELQEIQVHKHSYGETAYGIIYLEYGDELIDGDELIAEVKYDTVIGPDGLQTFVKPKVGDEVNCMYYGERERMQITEQMVKLARRAKAQVNVTLNLNGSKTIESIDIDDLE